MIPFAKPAHVARHVHARTAAAGRSNVSVQVLPQSHPNPTAACSRGTALAAAGNYVGANRFAVGVPANRYDPAVTTLGGVADHNLMHFSYSDIPAAAVGEFFNQKAGALI
jgi:hypothetical protein